MCKAVREDQVRNLLASDRTCDRLFGSGVLKASECFLALSTDLPSPIHQDLGNLGPRLMIL